MATIGEWSNDDLLAFYDDNYVLAIIIFNIINNAAYIYTLINHPYS